MVFMIKSVLVSVLMAATTTTAELQYDHPGRIVNGTDAEPGDYPYFVGMVYCGGTLIAPDIVLFAAHCGDYTGYQVHVGDWKTTQFSQERICAEWIPDPLYETGGYDFNYDFALCKLDEPAFIDESNVKLELNNIAGIPKEGKNLIVIGAGNIEQGGPFSGIVQSVKVPAMSNDQCKSISPFYQAVITDSMLCAGYLEGEKDACQGDSGGPLVRRKKNNDGTMTDTHVGVVSWGIGCAFANNPGVYARTSIRTDWIRETSCSMGSIASWCDDIVIDEDDIVIDEDDIVIDEEPISCTEQGLIPLIVKLETDKYFAEGENSWSIQNSSKEVIYVSENILASFITYSQVKTTVCLEPDQCYRFIIEDSFGDGMTECEESSVPGCGMYSLDVNNDEEFIEGVGDFLFRRTIEFCTGDGVNDFCPDDLEWFRFNKKDEEIQNCTHWMAVSEKGLGRKKKCKKTYYSKKGAYWCPDTCGEVGIGRCAKKN